MEDGRNVHERDRHEFSYLLVFLLVLVVFGIMYLILGKQGFALAMKDPHAFNKLVWARIGSHMMPVVHVLAWALLIYLCLNVVAIVTRLFHRYKRVANLETVDIVLSRDDTTEPFEITKFFDAVNGVLLPRFGWYAWFTGVPYLVWEQGIEEGKKFIRLSVPSNLLSPVCARLQATYQNVRFSHVTRTNFEVKRKFGMFRRVHNPLPIPRDILQLRLERNWFYPIQTLRNYQASITESFFASLERTQGDSCLQTVIVPLSLRRQTRLRKKHEAFESRLVRRSASNPRDPGLGFVAQKELQASFENRGKGLFRCEMRLFCDSKEARQAIIGAMAEASSENRLIAQSWSYYLALLSIKKVWWNWVVQRIPAFGFGPYVTLSSFHLATLFQLPSMRLRSAGFKRSPVRRIPVPQGVPRDPETAFITDEEGNLVGLQESERYGNVLFLGMQGQGKTTAMTGYAASVLSDPDQASIIITPDRSDAMKYLDFIPPDKPLYIIDLSRPGNWGLNQLSDDEVEADTVAGNLLSTFRTAYGKDALLWQSAEYLQQPFYALRKVRDLHAKWREAIPIIDLRHILHMLVDEEFRKAVTDDLPPNTHVHNYWTVQFPMMTAAKSEYARRVGPILNKLNELLSSERIEELLCHPNPITIRKVIDERAVLVLYTAKNEVGEETAVLLSNMLVSLVVQGISAQADLPEQERVRVNNFYDEVHGYANEALIRMLQEARKYGARTAAATLQLSDLPPATQDVFMQLFGSKVIFRINNMDEAEKWAKSFALRYTNIYQVNDDVQDRIIVGPEDFNSLPKYTAITRLVVDEQPLPAFLTRTMREDHRAHPEWGEYHKWPTRKRIEVGNITYVKPEPTVEVHVPIQPKRVQTEHPYNLTNEALKAIADEMDVSFNSDVMQNAMAKLLEAKKRNQKISTPVKYLKRIIESEIQSSNATNTKTQESSKNSSKAAKDKRYSNFYELFPDE